MQTTNNNKLFIESMGKKFEVRLLTEDAELANIFMENHPETSCIDETMNGIIIIANNEPSK